MSEDEYFAVVSPESEVRRYAEIEKRKAAQLGTELKAGQRQVFFYAASGFDWQSLHRFSHKCDTFVFVDPRATYAEWERERKTLEHGQTRAGANLKNAQLASGDNAYRDLADVTGELAEMRAEPWARIHDLHDRPAWGVVQKLKRSVGGQAKVIWLVFIAGSPLVAYRKLFIDTNTAPECLAIPVPEFPGQVAEENVALQDPPFAPLIQPQWAEFAGWDGELGHLLQENHAPLPKLLLAGGAMNWPTHSTHYLIRRWRSLWKTEVCTMTNNPWPDLNPATAVGKRHVVLTRKPMNPHAARSVGAVVIPNEKYHLYCWPDGVLVILSAPPLYDQFAVLDGPAVINLNIVEVPLLQALASIEAVCAERGISTVAIQGLPGFEDEAADLALWRKQDGQIKKLILHVECDGHFLDFAAAADEID